MKKTYHANIFIVEKDELVSMALKHEIEKAFSGYDITIFTFASIAHCELLINYKPHIVIINSRMNESSTEHGTKKSLMDKIKAVNSRVQMIMLSERESADSAVKALHYGAQDYIVKNEFMFKKLRLSLIQCFTILELRSNMRMQVSLGIAAIVLVFLMFGVALGLRAYVPESYSAPSENYHFSQKPAVNGLQIISSLAE